MKNEFPEHGSTPGPPDDAAYAAEVDSVLAANWASISRRAAELASQQAGPELARRAAVKLAWERGIERANWILAAAALLMIVQTSWAALNLLALVQRSTAAVAAAKASRDSAGDALRWLDDAPSTERSPVPSNDDSGASGPSSAGPSSPGAQFGSSARSFAEPQRA